MDDLKLFTPNYAGLQRLTDLVKTFSADIRITFGIQKCAKLTVKIGEPVSTGPVVTINDEVHELSYGKNVPISRISRVW